MNILRLLRIHQYVKNLFIFAPIFFAGNFDSDTFLKCTLAFLFFSLLASSIYIFNDLQDIQSDRLHPKKRYRPIASGLVSKKNASFIALFFVLISGGGDISYLGMFF